MSQDTDKQPSSTPSTQQNDRFGFTGSNNLSPKPPAGTGCSTSNGSGNAKKEK